MRVVKTFSYNDQLDIKTNALKIEQDINRIIECLKGRVRFGTGTDGDRGENIAGEFQVIADTGSANTQFSVTHTLGAVPVGYIILKNSKSGVIYDGTDAWTSTTIYLKCSAANAAITIFLII